MNLKTFAQESRTLLMEGVAQKLLYWGFDPKGEVLDQPEAISGGYLHRGTAFDDPGVPQLWEALHAAIRAKGIEVVVEEAAYTWFNRMMAMKILAKNGYDEVQLDYVEGMEHTPQILQRARQGRYDFLRRAEQERLQKIITDYTKDQEAFTLLLLGYCHAHKTLDTVFGGLDDYTELLLPDNMLQDGGFLHLLNTTDAISDEEYQQVELIGWLYQFYISERKDEVFASFKKNKKAEAKDIPAATQIFTPNWIVKYMVENTAGKIWLDKHPDSPLRSQMKYLVSGEEEMDVSSSAKRIENKSIITNVEELTLIDPAAGSGHILVEGFDLIYQMYMEEHYSPEEAVESILKHNLFGLDIDDRAAQLATFAILLKAAGRYRDVFAKGWMPQVYAMPEPRDFSTQEISDFLGAEGKAYVEELSTALRLMKQSKNLGSIMKLELSEAARIYIRSRFEALSQGDRDFNEEAVFQCIKPFIPVLLLLTQQYASVVANPPYMGQKNMNADLKKYVNANYPRSKSDLFAIFIEAMIDLLQEEARVGCITMESWMFLSSYEKLRNHLLENYSIASLAHFGWHIIGIAFGTASLILEKSKKIQIGEYSYLKIDDVDRERNVPFEFPKKDNGRFARIPQTNFAKIPGSPIAYWVSDRLIEIFEQGSRLFDHAPTKVGQNTGDNKRFLRDWTEIRKSKVRYDLDEEFDLQNNHNYKWIPYRKGGSFRKWYGNNEVVINWENDGQEIKEYAVQRNKGKHWSRYIQNLAYNLKEGFSWSFISSGSFGVRYAPQGSLFDVGGSSGFPINKDNIPYIISFLNCKIAFNLIRSINPTLNFQTGNVGSLPLIFSDSSDINHRYESSIKISRIDWDCRETSWDFERSPLLNETASIESAYEAWQEKVTQDFFQLHANEEELNRIFIDIYGLKEELTPDVPLKDITILQEELDRKELERLEPLFRAEGKAAITLPIDRAEVIAQFISYAIGLFMGRYRLDKPGLNIAHPVPTAEELASYTYNGGQVIIDEDAILPLMGSKCNFPDDALPQVHSLLDTIWGHDTRTENINFIQECLDKDLEKFLVKDFYKYHCGMYKKKPIYWLFSSPKGAFQVLVYMHRMNEFTVEKIRANYLLEHIKMLRQEESMMAGNESNLSTQEANKLDRIRKDLAECEAYDLELKNVADQQIKFDLDDGVKGNYELFKGVVAKIK